MKIFYQNNSYNQTLFHSFTMGLWCGLDIAFKYFKKVKISKKQYHKIAEAIAKDIGKEVEKQYNNYNL